MIKKYWRRFLVWVGMIKLRPEVEVKRLLKEAIKVEEQHECDHKMLSALFPNDVWYRCTNCNQVWIITEAMQLKANKIKDIIKKLQQIIGMKQKNKTVKSLKDYEDKK